MKVGREAFIDRLRNVADSVEDVPLTVLRSDVDEVYEFLTGHLIPHAQAEDQALYPFVGRAMGAPEATATMSRDHVEVGRLTNELATLRMQISGCDVHDDHLKALRRILYGLYALVKVHFAKEEEIYLPLLDSRLEPAEAHHMFESLEVAAAHAKAHAGEIPSVGERK